MKSLYKQYLLTVLVVMGIAFVFFTWAMLSISRSYVILELEHNTQKNAQFLGAYTSSYLQDHSLSDSEYQAYVKNMALVSDSFIFVTSLEGTDSYATDGTNFYPIKRNDVSREVVNMITNEGEYQTYTDLGGIFTEERYVHGVTYTRNVAGSAVAVGFVVISPNTGQLEEIWDGFGEGMAVLVVGLVLISMFFVSVFSARQSKPLRELSETARRFGKGDLNARVLGYEGRTDEAGIMMRDFNSMANSIAKAEESRSAFISNLSHELKTPMTTISGFAEGMLDGTVKPEKREKSLQIIVAETRRLARLVQQMLELSHIEAEDLSLAQEEFDLVELLAQVIISMEAKILGRNLDVDVDIPEGELLVWGNGDAITQVCYNLLDNATKFATPGSVIVVSVEVRERKVLVSVKNQGETMDPEQLPLLFQRFHKADASRHDHPEGLGLGLYIVKSILGKLQEEITVTSKEGVTCFTFTLSLV